MINPYIEPINDVLMIPETRLLLIASLFRFAAGFSIGIWKAPFIYEKFPEFTTQFSTSNAFIIAIGGLCSSFFGGIVADNISNPNNSFFNQPKAKVWIPAIGSLLAIPAWILFISSNDPMIAGYSLFAEYLVAECWFGPALATLYSSVPINRKGVAQGMFSIITGLANFAPFLIGSLTNKSNGNVPLDQTLIWTISLCYAVSGMAFLQTALNEDKKSNLS